MNFPPADRPGTVGLEQTGKRRGYFVIYFEYLLSGLRLNLLIVGALVLTPLMILTPQCQKTFILRFKYKANQFQNAVIY